MVVGAQSISAVSTLSTVSSEHWVASPTLETECSANFYISEYFTNYLFNIRDISRYLIDTKYKMLENIRYICCGCKKYIQKYLNPKFLKIL